MFLINFIIIYYSFTTGRPKSRLKSGQRVFKSSDLHKVKDCMNYLQKFYPDVDIK